MNNDEKKRSTEDKNIIKKNDDKNVQKEKEAKKKTTIDWKKEKTKRL